MGALNRSVYSVASFAVHRARRDFVRWNGTCARVPNTTSAAAIETRNPGSFPQASDAGRAFITLARYPPILTAFVLSLTLNDGIGEVRITEYFARSLSGKTQRAAGSRICRESMSSFNRIPETVARLKCWLRTDQSRRDLGAASTIEAFQLRQILGESQSRKIGPVKPPFDLLA